MTDEEKWKDVRETKEVKSAELDDGFFVCLQYNANVMSTEVFVAAGYQSLRLLEHRCLRLRTCQCILSIAECAKKMEVE